MHVREGLGSDLKAEMIIIQLFKLLWEMELLRTKFKCMFFWTRKIVIQGVSVWTSQRYGDLSLPIKILLAVYLPVKQTK